MWTLFKNRPLLNLLQLETIPLALALFIAETFFKFHSFLLETGAFLVVWLVLGAVQDLGIQMMQRVRGSNPVSD